MKKTNNNKEFKDEFKEIITNKDNNELIKFLSESFDIKEHVEKVRYRKVKKFVYGEIKEEQVILAISKINYMNLKRLDLFTINHAIARMNIIIEGFKSIGSMSFIITLFIAYMTIYETFISELVGNILGSMISLVMVLIIIFSYLKSMRKDKKNLLVAVYLKTFLEDIKKEKLNQL